MISANGYNTSRIHLMVFHLMVLNRFHQIFKECLFEKSRWQQSYLTELINNDLNYRDDYEQRLAQRKQFFNPENGDAPSMQSLEDSSRITNMGLLVKASIVLTFTVLLFFLQNIPVVFAINVCGN